MPKNKSQIDFLDKKEKNFVIDLKNNLKEKLEKNFIDLILFGSKARGESTSDSDIDIILVVTSMEYEDFVDDILFDLQMQYDMYNISLLLYTQKEYEVQMGNSLNIFFENIKKEGIAV